MNTSLLHEKALSLSQTYRQSESELLGILIEMQKRNSFSELSYPSLFSYCVIALVEKAKRGRKSKAPTSGKLTASIRHEVNQRDQGKCQAMMPNGRRCHSTFWVHHHHVQPKSLGGANTLENLTTLCSSHHRMIHQSPSPLEKVPLAAPKPFERTHLSRR